MTTQFKSGDEVIWIDPKMESNGDTFQTFVIDWIEYRSDGRVIVANVDGSYINCLPKELKLI